MAQQNQNLSAREKLALERAKSAAAQRRNRALMWGVMGLVAVLAIVGSMWALTRLSDKNTASEQQPFIKEMLSVTPATFNEVGPGLADGQVIRGVDGGKIQMENGKPRLLFIGGEFCPYCAMERWSLTLALSRFGTFTGLEQHVTPSDEAAMPTVTYRDASYSSKYLTFKHYEAQSEQGVPLNKVSPEDQKIWDASPGARAFPFLYWGTAWSGTTLNTPQIFTNGNGATIAAQLNNPSSAEAQAIVGEANLFSAKICQLTKNQPAAVCSSKGVTEAAKRLTN